jgi:hypothetical protein
MKRRPTPAAGSFRQNRARTSTGEHCPATGWWIPEGTTEPWQYLSEGNLVPPLNGAATSWILAAHNEIRAGAGPRIPSRGTTVGS